MDLCMNSAIPDKLFFKIGEVAHIADVEQHVLRYWEDEFDTLQPDKNRSGQRLYQKKDVRQVLRIKKLLYEEKYTIAGARKKLKSKKKASQQLNLNFDPDELIKWKKKLKRDLESVLEILK